MDQATAKRLLSETHEMNGYEVALSTILRSLINTVDELTRQIAELQREESHRV